MPLKAPPIPVSAAAVAIGLVVTLAGLIALLELSGRFLNTGAGITAPGSITVTLDPDQRHAVMRERAGAHITNNRPLLDKPADLTITVTDARTGDPIPTEPNSWWYQQNIFGHSRLRTGIAQFTTPDHGEVTIAIDGSFAYEQPYRITPTFDAFARRYGTPLAILIAAGGLTTLAGLVAILLRVTATAKQAESTPFSDP